MKRRTELCIQRRAKAVSLHASQISTPRHNGLRRGVCLGEIEWNYAKPSYCTCIFYIPFYIYFLSVVCVCFFFACVPFAGSSSSLFSFLCCAMSKNYANALFKQSLNMLSVFVHFYCWLIYLFIFCCFIMIIIIIFLFSFLERAVKQWNYDRTILNNLTNYF